MPRIKHYKVMNTGKNYTIELEKPVRRQFFVVDKLPPVAFQTFLYRLQGKVGKQKSSSATDTVMSKGDEHL